LATLLPSSAKRNPLKRYYGENDLHFVTFSCYHRKAYLGTPEARDVFVNVLDEIRNRHSFRLIGYVGMPEHVHLLIGEPALSNPSVVLQTLKQRTAKQLLRMSGSETASGRQAHFWQRRFYDFNVWTEAKLREKLDYIHGNPVRRELVSHPGDWPWSSWACYKKSQPGKIRIDLVW
jgi:putative transposase